MSEYSDELLTNPGAETGDMTGWVSASTSVVSGGSAESYCFKVANDGYMSQSGTPSRPPTEFKFSGDFLPEYEIDPDETDNICYAEITYNYDDATADKHNIPLKFIEE